MRVNRAGGCWEESSRRREQEEQRPGAGGPEAWEEEVEAEQWGTRQGAREDLSPCCKCGGLTGRGASEPCPLPSPSCSYSRSQPPCAHSLVQAS